MLDFLVFIILLFWLCTNAKNSLGMIPFKNLNGGHCICCREQDLNNVKVLQAKPKPAIPILAIWTGLTGHPAALTVVEEVKGAIHSVQKKKTDQKAPAKKWAWIANTLNISLNATLGTSPFVLGKLNIMSRLMSGRVLDDIMNPRWLPRSFL